MIKWGKDWESKKKIIKIYNFRFLGRYNNLNHANGKLKCLA